MGQTNCSLQRQPRIVSSNAEVVVFLEHLTDAEFWYAVKVYEDHGGDIWNKCRILTDLRNSDLMMFLMEYLEPWFAAHVPPHPCGIPIRRPIFQYYIPGACCCGVEELVICGCALDPQHSTSYPVQHVPSTHRPRYGGARSMDQSQRTRAPLSRQIDASSQGEDFSHRGSVSRRLEHNRDETDSRYGSQRYSASRATATNGHEHSRHGTGGHHTSHAQTHSRHQTQGDSRTRDTTGRGLESAMSALQLDQGHTSRSGRGRQQDTERTTRAHKSHQHSARETSSVMEPQSPSRRGHHTNTKPSRLAIEAPPAKEDRHTKARRESHPGSGATRLPMIEEEENRRTIHGENHRTHGESHRTHGESRRTHGESYRTRDDTDGTSRHHGQGESQHQRALPAPFKDDKITRRTSTHSRKD